MTTDTYHLFGTALFSALARLRDRHGDMTLLQAQCLALVAANPDITQIELCRATGMSDATASRTIAMLTDLGSRAVEGMDLVRMTVDPEDRRLRLLNLTPKGRRLMDDLMADLKKWR